MTGTAPGTGNGTTKLNRDQIRAKIFNTKPQSETMELFGVEVEIRQPSLGVILEAQSGGDRTKAIANLLINYCFVPGTNDRVFEEADADSILQLPFGDDMTRVQDVIAKLTGVDIAGEEKNLEEKQDSTMST